MEKMVFTVKEVSEIIHTNQSYVYKLINTGVLPALKLGSYKIRRDTLIKFLEDYEGYDLTNPEAVTYNKAYSETLVDKNDMSSICPPIPSLSK